MASPLIPQGTLNRAITSVSFINFPELNVSAGFFGTKVARMSPEGDASDYIGTLTGAVPSPRLYQMYSVTMYLNKSQGLAAQWEQQRLTISSLGDAVIITDSPVLPPYYLANCTLMNTSDLDLSGDSNDFPVIFKGTYFINGSLFG